MATLYRNLEERLMANSVPTDHGHATECWDWIGNVDDDGYGRITLRVAGRHRKLRAHRCAFTTLTGQALADDETLDHTCRNKRCINPGHQEVVSREENSARMREFWKQVYAAKASQRLLLDPVQPDFEGA